MDGNPLGRALTALGTFTARPTAFVIVLVYAAFWIALDRESFNWHGAATLATWLMTLVIQRAEHRDTQALQAKIDELLKAHEKADDSVTHIDNREPETIERKREAEGH
jgi:low affinity Fe/Cu permease